MKRAVWLSLSLSSGAFAVSPFAPPETPPGVRIPHPAGDAFLLRPATCAPTCSLVVVSHSRGMSAELSLARPHLRQLFATLTDAGYAVLVSNDAGPTSWGAPQALAYLADVRARAIKQFAFSGRTYNLGYSMGGLPALLSAYQGIYPVSGVMLLDAQVSLLNVWQGHNAAFRDEVTAAHALSVRDPLPFGRDPLLDYSGPRERQLPVFVAGSAHDQTVAFTPNGRALFARSTSAHSRLLELPGAHLSASHFGGVFADGVLLFLNGLEHAALTARR